MKKLLILALFLLSPLSIFAKALPEAKAAEIIASYKLRQAQKKLIACKETSKDLSEMAAELRNGDIMFLSSEAFNTYNKFQSELESDCNKLEKQVIEAQRVLRKAQKNVKEITDALDVSNASVNNATK